MIKFTGPEDRIIRVTDRLSDKLSEKLSDKEKRTFELLIEDSGYTSPQIAEKLGVSRVLICVLRRRVGGIHQIIMEF